MPSSSGSSRIEPPDPIGVVRRSKGGRGAPTPGAGGDPTAYRRYDRAADPQWEQFRNRGGQGASVDDVMGAIDLEGDAATNTAMGDLLSKGPFEAISWDDPWGTVTTTTGDFYTMESASYLEDEGFYSGRGYTYTNNGSSPSTSLVSSVGTQPAPITYSPTSTTDPNRPRTVAAGWDRDRKVMTVVFRDGTFYNYYGVSGLEWGNFKRAHSKGESIRKYFDGKARGVADVGSVPQAHQELLYKVARTSQVMRKGLTGSQSAKSARRKKPKEKAPRLRYGQSGTSASGGRRYAASRARAAYWKGYAS